MSLIPADNDFAMWAIMLLLVALIFRLERTNLGQKVSGTIMMILAGVILANFNVISASNNVFSVVNTTGVPIAIVLLLFNANLKKIFKECGPTLIAFIFGAIGTTLGTIIGVKMLPLGEFEAELAAVFSATFVGGSANFAGVASAIDFTESSVLAASIAADNVVGVSFMLLLIAIPSMKFIAKKFSYDPTLNEYDDVNEVVKEEKPFSIEQAVLSLGMAFLVVVVSDVLSVMVGYPPSRLLILTTITVMIATFAHEKVGKLTEAFPIGIAIMYLFFGAIGASVNILTMLESGMLLALFAIIILSVHLVTLLLLCKLFKIGLPEALVGSNACILGPPTAAAMAGGLGWKSLVTPAILCGTFGYAMANFIGITIFGILG